MAHEREWLRVEVRSFVSDGGADGSITLSSTSGFKVKQKVKITAIGESPLVLEVKRVISPTTLLVGPFNQNINIRTNLSAYTVAKASGISAETQSKKFPTDKDIHSFIYEQEPTVAYRTISVDEYGDFYSSNNPLPVDAPKYISGTIDGEETGDEYIFVNNLRQQILSAHDVNSVLTYVDPGTKAERITRIEYTSPTFSGTTIRKDITYINISGSKYIINTINWSVV